MPNSLIKSISKQTGEKKPALENTYKALEKQATKNGATNKYAYATSVIQRMSGYNPKNESN